MQGWIKLWRKCIQGDVFSDEKAWRVFCVILTNCTFQPHTAKTAVGDVHLKPGQWITSMRSLYAQVYPGKRVVDSKARGVWKALKRLEKRGTIHIQSVRSEATLHQQGQATRFSIVSLVNWEDYQCDSKDDGTRQGTRQGTKRRRKKEESTTVLSASEPEEGELGGSTPRQDSPSPSLRAALVERLGRWCWPPPVEPTRQEWARVGRAVKALLDADVTEDELIGMLNAYWEGAEPTPEAVMKNISSLRRRASNPSYRQRSR